MATQYTYEFEIYSEGCEGGWLVAEPFDLDGGTQGLGVAEACRMAADWLRCEAEARVLRGETMPPAVFGHEPRHGGQIAVVSVQAGLDTVPRMSAAEAARMLGVSPGRVSQMLAAKLLDGWREGGRTWVTRASVEARASERPKAGRPREHELAAV
jgi:hypothetical protein